MGLLSLIKKDEFREIESLLDKVKPEGYKLKPIISDLRDKEQRNYHKIGHFNIRQLRADMKNMNEIMAKHTLEIGKEFIKNLKSKDPQQKQMVTQSIKDLLDRIGIRDEKYLDDVIRILEDNVFAQNLFLIGLILGSFAYKEILFSIIESYAMNEENLAPFLFMCNTNELWCIGIEKEPKEKRSSW